MAAGKINLQANDGKVAGIVFEDGASANQEVVIPKEGGVLATEAAVSQLIDTVNPNVPAPYHIYNGKVEVSNTVATNGFATTLWTGNGATQDVVTGVDMSTQWGDDASETFGGLVWLKSRSEAYNHILQDTIRGTINAKISTNTTDGEGSAGVLDSYGKISSFNNNGVTVVSGIQTNNTSATYASWNFQTTHRTSGVTNHGKPYTCHYNPFTGFTIIKYEGSGIVGHEIPHHLGRKLGFWTVKVTTTTTNWLTQYKDNNYLYLNTNQAQTNGITVGICSDTSISFNTTPEGNGASQTHILYGWANSYFDESNKLIGNYEIGVYQGTGVAGNKVTTRGKPAWIMVKRLDSTGNWVIQDNLRTSNTGVLNPNTAGTEQTGWEVIVIADGNSFTINATASEVNASGGQYLYMVVYDNDSGSGRSKYPRATDTSELVINAHVPYADGIDTSGTKISIQYKDESITLSNSLASGKNYVASLNDGTYVAKQIAPGYGTTNPATGDFFNLDTQKWYDSSNAEVTPRNYLDCIVHADGSGNVLYVEQLPKTDNSWEANDYRVKKALNASGTAPIYACRAWVNFNGTGTVAIRGSGNVSSITDNGTGDYTVNFITAMEDINYSIVGSSALNTADQGCVSPYILTTTNARVGTTGIVNGVVTATTNGDHLNINIAIFR